MKIQFLGTAAAEGIPAMFCNCENCKAIRSLGESQLRTRSQVVIDDILSIDFPPEAFYHSIKFGVLLSKLKHLLVTHSHMDHFYAHDFILRGYKYAELIEPKLEIYGNPEVKNVFYECTAREMKPEVKPNVVFTEVAPYSSFTVGNYRVLTIPATHCKNEEALLFYIESNGKGYLHLYDTGLPEEEVYKFLSEHNAHADVVCFDCTFLDNRSSKSVRHMGIDDNMYVKSKLTEYAIADVNTKFIISHFSHNSFPTSERLKQIEKEYDVVAAYDGYTVVI